MNIVERRTLEYHIGSYRQHNACYATIPTWERIIFIEYGTSESAKFLRRVHVKSCRALGQFHVNA